ncbi:MAG: IS1380 family transposase [Deltaproteobacteria bacterium]|nr:MAG: IS1380 family transposase [Deltaproteobacteria bacterium]
MPQTLLPFQYEKDPTRSKFTALGGLPLFLDLMTGLGVVTSLRRNLACKSDMNGWSVSDVVLALILVNLAGGECVEDLDRLNADVGFGQLMDLANRAGYSRQQRRALKRKLAKLKLRKLPSKSAAFRKLEKFHDPQQEQEKARRREQARESGKGKSYIQKPNGMLKGLLAVLRHLVAAVQQRSRQTTATLDQDATLVETLKAEALRCYKGYKAYQPLNTYWAEQGLVVHTEFRDGNVPAGFEQLRVLREALENLPEGVEKVYLRSDTAGYQQELLKYCAEGKNEQFGVIEFAVGVDVCDEFKKAVAEVEEDAWLPLKKQVGGEWVDTGQEWAEVCYVPNWAGYKKNGPRYRYLATREPLRQLELPGVEQEQRELPFPTMEFGQGDEKRKYKVFGVVTNRDLAGDEVIGWLRKRCGYSEQVHAVMKEDLGGGRMPSGKFGVNAAWWQVMVLALNLSEVMKRLVLGAGWTTKRLKALRFRLIHIGARVVEKGRRLWIRLSRGEAALELLTRARERIRQLAEAPG